jgi:hypothetical protein
MTYTLAHYERAVWDNPRKSGEGAMSYMQRIAELVASGKLPEPLKDMPEVRLPYADR